MSAFTKIGRWTVVIAVLACVALATAQGGGGRGRGGGGGQGGRFGGQFGAGPAQLASRADVQRDIAATDDQKSKIAALQQKLAEERRNMFGGGGGGGGGGGFDPEAMRQAMEKMNETAKAELAKILNPDQMARLDQIGIQLAGARAILLPAVQKELGLDEGTIAKARELIQKQGEANRSIMERVRNQEISREEAQAARQKNDEALNAELAKLLSAEQAAKLKSMGGKEFKADPPQRPPL